MTEPTAVEAGAYLMEAHKPGYYRLRRNITISGGVLTREPVELNQALARGDVGAGSGTGANSGGEDAGLNDEPGSGGWWTSPAVGWSLIGLGTATGVASTISFVTREDRVERWNDDTRCIRGDGSSRLNACQQFKDDAETAQTIGIVTGIAGVVLVGGGIAHLLATQGSDDTADSGSERGGLRLARCDAGLMSVACYGSF
jgi:hypothetical protein